MQKQYLRIIEVAKLLGIGRSKAYELVASGEIPSVRFGERTVRVSRDALDKWIEEKGGSTE